ncbi:hypothetical protein [Enterococcus wangshanyuanii]|uniref:DUF1310 domain-containing protein n=1 Tax=Enterococcus wangshanyuanii TaxID=2005703 RepID=A0ABQ1P2J1_9ENTE|nr:hypothetical protein [Enterococcus wangshanyuanii]GGC89833.1 hypothetical protein GCM10011573_19350 [Enterococcus wangshanyuanii]
MNKRIAVIVGIIALVFIGFGGILYMNKRAEEESILKKTHIYESEKMAVLAMKNTFSEIKSIEFLETIYNSTTDSYNMIVKMTDIEGESVEFSIGFMDKDSELQDYGIENRNIQKEGKTENKVLVIYSNSIEGEI